MGEFGFIIWASVFGVVTVGVVCVFVALHRAYREYNEELWLLADTYRRLDGR